MSILPANPTDEEIDERADQLTVFIQEYLKTGNAMVACSRAGIRDVRYTMEVVAQRTLDDPMVQVALKAFDKVQVSMQPIEVSRDSIVADMEVVYNKALDDRQYGSAISAKKLQSMLLALLQQNINVTHRISAQTMSDAELLRIAGQNDRKIIDVDVEDSDD